MTRYRKIENIHDLKVGDIVKSKLSETSYTVVAHFGDRVTAVKIADITNIIEWQVLRDNK